MIFFERKPFFLLLRSPHLKLPSAHPAKTVRWSNKKTWKSSNKAFGKDWRLRKIGNSFASELSKIENDRDVWNLKNEDKVEIVYEPRRDNIVKKAVVEDIKNLSQAGINSQGETN